MKAIVCMEGELSVREVKTPEPGPGQILIKVLRTGICGSDLHAAKDATELHSLMLESGYTTAILPHQEVILGHELLGEVVSYGPKTRGRWAAGTTVTALPILHTDAGMHLTGFDIHAAGGYAEYTLVEEALTFPVPDGVSPDRAAFTEPLTIARHAVRRSGISKKRPAVVIGCGPIGLATILMLKAAGVREVIASDLSPGRRKLAAQCGADVVVDPKVQSPWDALTITDPVNSTPELLAFALKMTKAVRRIPWLSVERALFGADQLGKSPSGPVVFECAGVPGMIDHIIANAPLRSLVTVVGMCTEVDTFRPAVALSKEIDLRFVFGYDPAEFSQTLGMIASGEVDPSPLHTATVGLDGVARAFNDLSDPEHHAKILIDPTR
ncbi:zinc-binding dehydrogenase [Mycobacterium sp. ITM-2016-00317]|uniref:zinc-binding dehydrogenase n=1 Tax=Mycobacterium sp. ITM-2016-00317 TaxID=2099694 RepID=UPI00287F4D99|nr:zinc-binding dehydrogenase [Mycobacterium sp. ITM-2016-00317]WNG88029.1 zinc-binding dehydrogenase [Mycobacterium sp. ITM-2016-00317]